MIVISDTSAITNLVAIRHLHLLFQLYNQVIIPEAVYRELTDAEPSAPATLKLQAVSWLEVKQIANRKIVKLLQERYG